MSIRPAAKAVIEYEGKNYYFCSKGCAERFSGDPKRYLAPSQPVVHTIGMIRPPQSAPAAPTAAGNAGMYTCPMHPEVIQKGPGACPKCGMALEPMVAGPEEEPNHELIDMTRRFWISAALTLPVFLLGMSDLLPGQPVQHALSASLLVLIQLDSVHSCCFVGRQTVFPAWLGFDFASQPQHVHSHRNRYGHSLRLQCRSGFDPRHFSTFFSRSRWSASGLL